MRKYLKSVRMSQFLKVKNCLLELEKYFIELKDGKLKDREVKVKREIEQLLFKQIVVSIDNMDKFDQKEMKKIRQIKNTWYDWLTVPEPIRKSVGGLKEGGLKDKVISLFKKNTPKQTVFGEEKN